MNPCFPSGNETGFSEESWGRSFRVKAWFATIRRRNWERKIMFGRLSGNRSE